MITGVHSLIYSQKAVELRAFFRDVVQWPAVDSGGGWLIFALPPTELGIHPTEGVSKCELYLMCDSLEPTMVELRNRGVEFTRAVTEESFGRVTAIRLPDGSSLGLYEPRHPTAHGLPA